MKVKNDYDGTPTIHQEILALSNKRRGLVAKAVKAQAAARKKILIDIGEIELRLSELRSLRGVAANQAKRTGKTVSALEEKLGGVRALLREAEILLESFFEQFPQDPDLEEWCDESRDLLSRIKQSHNYGGRL